MSHQQDFNQPSQDNKKSKLQIKKALEVKISDVSIVENVKIYVLIMMYTFDSKDELYFFLVNISKRYGLEYLREYYLIIDKYLPMKHNEKTGVQVKLMNTINQHDSGVNQIVKLSNTKMITISDDCSMKIWNTKSTGTSGD